MLEKVLHSTLAPSFIGAGGVAILGVIPNVHDVVNLAQISIVLFTTILQIISIFKKKPPVVVVEPIKRTRKKRTIAKKVNS